MTGFKKWLFGLAGALVICAMAAGLFYAEELHRGKQAWENCRRELAAKGVKLNWDEYLPSSVADDENVFGVREVQEWFGGYDYGVTARLAPSKLPDTDKLTPEIAANFLQSNAKFDHDFDILREALQRPYSQIRGNYKRTDRNPGVSISSLVAFARTANARARCHVLLHQSDAALDEVVLLDDMCRGLLEQQKPVGLLAAWIDALFKGACAGTISRGIRSNCWNDAQLTTLEGRLKASNILKTITEAYTVERAVVLCQAEPAALAQLAKKNVYIDKDQLRQGEWNQFLARIVPRGWAYLGAADAVDTESTIIGSMHSEDKTMDLKAFKAAAEKFENLSPHWAPKAFLYNVKLSVDRAGQLAAYNQTKINEALLACALERHRLAQGDYPETLAALAPRFIDQIPHDVIDSLPMHYHRSGTNSFVLYSIGWNEQDDGGTRGHEDYPYTNGDWVW